MKLPFLPLSLSRFTQFSLLCEALMQMKEQLSEEEAELYALADSVLNKLSQMDDETFDELNLYPDF